jgi:hypothetical protein
MAEHPNPATVRDPSFRQTILCTALAHSRGKIHATFMRGHQHAPYAPEGKLMVPSLEAQAKLLKHYLGEVKRYAMYWGKMYSKDQSFRHYRKQAELTALEFEIIESICELPVDVEKAA